MIHCGSDKIQSPRAKYALCQRREQNRTRTILINGTGRQSLANGNGPTALIGHLRVEKNIIFLHSWQFPSDATETRISREYLTGDLPNQLREW